MNAAAGLWRSSRSSRRSRRRLSGPRVGWRARRRTRPGCSCPLRRPRRRGSTSPPAMQGRGRRVRVLVYLAARPAQPAARCNPQVRAANVPFLRKSFPKPANFVPGPKPTKALTWGRYWPSEPRTAWSRPRLAAALSAGALSGPSPDRVLGFRRGPQRRGLEVVCLKGSERHQSSRAGPATAGTMKQCKLSRTARASISSNGSVSPASARRIARDSDPGPA